METIPEKHLEHVIREKNLEELKKLIDGGLDVNKPWRHLHESAGSFGPHGLEDQRTALVFAVWEGWTEGVKLLLDSGADLEQPDYMMWNPRTRRYTPSWWYTPLYMSVSFAHQMSKRRSWRYTPLMHAIRYHQREVTHELLARGACVTVRDPYTLETPLHVATNRGDVETADLLLQKGAEVDAVSVADGLRPTTPLLCALELGSLQWPPDFNSMDKYQDLLRSTRLRLVRLLLDRGADVNLCGGDDTTPLGMCVRKGDAAVTALLLRAGATVNHVTPRKPPHGSVAEEWVESGKTTTAAPKLPVVEALECEKPAELILLVQHGADIFEERVIDEWVGKQSVLEFSLERSSLKCAAVLLDAGSEVTDKARETIAKKYTNYFPQKSAASAAEKVKGENLEVFPEQAKVGQVEHLWNGTAELPPVEEFAKLAEAKEDDLPELESDESDSESSVDDSCSDFDDEDDDGSSSDSLSDTFSSGSDVSDVEDPGKWLTRSLMRRLEDTRTLKWHARTSVRRNLGAFEPTLVRQLPLPKSLQEYLLCSELRPQNYEVPSE